MIRIGVQVVWGATGPLRLPERGLERALDPYQDQAAEIRTHQKERSPRQNIPVHRDQELQRRPEVPRHRPASPADRPSRRTRLFPPPLGLLQERLQTGNHTHPKSQRNNQPQSHQALAQPPNQR